MWTMPLYLHINKKSHYDDDDVVQCFIGLYFYMDEERKFHAQMS